MRRWPPGVFHAFKCPASTQRWKVGTDTPRRSATKAVEYDRRGLGEMGSWLTTLVSPHLDDLLTCDLDGGLGHQQVAAVGRQREQRDRFDQHESGDDGGGESGG